MIRNTLPNRRLSYTDTISFVRSDGKTVYYDATVGFDRRDRPREIFLNGAKEGSDMSALLSDTAVALSVALQFGVTATAMVRSVGQLDGMPGSIIGAALQLIAKYEAEASDA